MQVRSGRKALTTGRCLLLAHGAMFTDTALLGTDTGTHLVLCRADTLHTCCCRPQQHSATVALVGWSVFLSLFLQVRGHVLGCPSLSCYGVRVLGCEAVRPVPKVAVRSGIDHR